MAQKRAGSSLLAPKKFTLGIREAPRKLAAFLQTPGEAGVNGKPLAQVCRRNFSVISLLECEARADLPPSARLASLPHTLGTTLYTWGQTRSARGGAGGRTHPHPCTEGGGFPGHATQGASQHSIPQIDPKSFDGHQVKATSG